MSSLAAQVEAFVAQLQARANELVERVHREMYANPFWKARFGERGEKFSREDGHFHLKYLSQALLAGSPGTLEEYARWLQSVLATRGMCSRHLAENYQRLGRAIAEAFPAEGSRAVQYLASAEAALTYREGPARAVQQAAAKLAQRAADDLYKRHPEWLERGKEAGRARCVDDLQYHLSYVADALALGAYTTFEAYAVWIAGFLAGFGVPVDHMDESLWALDAAADELPEEHRLIVRQMLQAGIAALERSRNPGQRS